MHWLLPKVAQSFLCLLFVLLFAGCGNSYYHGSTTDHFDGRKFYNPWAPMPDSFGDFLKWRLTSDRGSWPESVPVTPSTPPVRVPGDTLRVTYVGHATVLLQTQGLNILTDPIWSERASPLSFAGPQRVAAPGVRFEDIPPIDVVLVSHNHYDHLDLPTLERLFKAFNPLVLAPLGNNATMLGAIPGLRVKVLDWGESFELNRQVRFTLEHRCSTGRPAASLTGVKPCGVLLWSRPRVVLSISWRMPAMPPMCFSATPHFSGGSPFA